MRKMILSTIVLLMILPAMFFITASCSKKLMQSEPAATTQPEVQEVAEAPRELPQAPAEQADEVGPQQEAISQAQAPAAEAPETEFSIENIQFAFDSSELSYQVRMLLSSKADYLRINPAVSLTIEGHCDERGTDAYNMALGERRAESVKSFLVNLGIGADRLSTISYGEKQPIATGQNEEAWARNRRAQFVID